MYILQIKTSETKDSRYCFTFMFESAEQALNKREQLINEGQYWNSPIIFTRVFEGTI